MIIPGKGGAILTGLLQNFRYQVGNEAQGRHGSLGLHLFYSCAANTTEYGSLYKHLVLAVRTTTFDARLIIHYTAYGFVSNISTGFNPYAQMSDVTRILNAIIDQYCAYCQFQ